MKNKFYLLIFFTIVILLNNCSEKITYSGKILNNNIDFSKIENKYESINLLGQPNYIDPIENKFYYFSEQKNTKNYFDKKITNRIVIVFSFNNNDQVKSFTQYNLEDEQNIKYVKESTQNELFERGLIEKVFGGVGSATVPTN